MTYIGTKVGFVYTAFVTDVFSRKIVGWQTRSSMKTQALPLEALDQAIAQARGNLEGGSCITVTTAPSTSRLSTTTRSQA